MEIHRHCGTSSGGGGGSGSSSSSSGSSTGDHGIVIGSSGGSLMRTDCIVTCVDEDDDELCGVRCDQTTALLVEQNGMASGSSRSPSLSPSPLIHHEDGSDPNQQQHPVKQWSYEEQFRQLYNLSDEAERKEFLDKLFDYMTKKGTPITRIPIMAKQPLDMYKLFKLVVERGGLVEVIKKKAWRDIAKELNLPASITSAAFTMRSQYVKYLYPYECEVECLSDPKELQVAIESNKRDRRHSDNMEFGQNSGRIETEKREQIIPQPYTVTGTPSGLQLIGSPTVALPHSTIPPYSGGFIITPSGHHIVHTPRISTAGPQLLQMATTHPQLPIVVPSTLPGTSPLQAATMVPIKSESASPTISDRKIHEERQYSDSPPPTHPTPHIPLLIRPGLHSNIPAMQPGGVVQLKNDITPDRRHDVASLTKEREHRRSPNDDQLPPSKKMAVDNTNSESSLSTTSRMPFTNISIRQTSGSSSLENSPSILVQIELNNMVYQGVLFARPITTNSSNISSPPR